MADLNQLPAAPDQAGANTVNNIPLVEVPNITIYYQRSTTNRSFIEMSEYLRMCGIKNHRFMLALLDPELANVDPYDPTLSTVTKLRIFREITANPWYFLREVCRVPSVGEPSKFILNRGNMAFLYLAMMNINTFLEMPRQTGKTIAAAAYYLYVFNFRASNALISLANKEWKDSKDNLARIRGMRDLLPNYLRFDAPYSEVNGKKVKVSTTATFLENAINHNKFKTYGKARNELAAANMMRGQTITLAWFDELAFIPFMRVIYGNMIPAMSKATAIAKMNNVPYGLLYTTTPGFLTTEEGKYAYEIRANASQWSEQWYDLSYEQVLNIIASNKMSNFVYIEYNYQQLGYDDNWLSDRIKELGHDWPLIRREILLEWSDESSNNPFTKEELDMVKKFCREPKKSVMIFGQYKLDIFKEIPLKSNLVPKYPPIIGVDPAGGLSRDWSAITIIDSHTTEVFAELRSNSIGLMDLARVIEYIVLTMMPNAIIQMDATGVPEISA